MANICTSICTLLDVAAVVHGNLTDRQAGSTLSWSHVAALTRSPVLLAYQSLILQPACTQNTMPLQYCSDTVPIEPWCDSPMRRIAPTASITVAHISDDQVLAKLAFELNPLVQAAAA